MSERRRKVEWSLDLENLRARAGQFVSDRMGEPAKAKRASLREALKAAESARILIERPVGRTAISALAADSPNLFEAELSYAGDYDFDVSGGVERVLSLRQKASFGAGLPAMTSGAEDWYCDIALAPGLPLTLALTGGIGESDIDLSQLLVERCRLEAGVGDLRLTTPLLEAGFAIELIGGVGKAVATIPAGGRGRLKIAGGLGAVKVLMAPGAAARLRGKAGLGKISLPESFERRAEDRWETATFEEAANPVEIDYTGGVGSFSLEPFAVV